MIFSIQNLGCYKPTPLRMNFVLEIRWVSEQMREFLFKVIFPFPCRFSLIMSAPLNPTHPNFRSPGLFGNGIQNLHWHLLVS